MAWRWVDRQPRICLSLVYSTSHVRAEIGDGGPQLPGPQRVHHGPLVGSPPRDVSTTFRAGRDDEHPSDAIGLSPLGCPTLMIITEGDVLKIELDHQLRTTRSPRSVAILPPPRRKRPGWAVGGHVKRSGVPS